MHNLLMQLRPDQAALVHSVVSDTQLEGVANRKQLQIRLQAESDWRIHTPETALALKKLISDLDTPDTQQQPSSVSTKEAINRFLAHKEAGGLAKASIKSYRIILNLFARKYPTLPNNAEEIEAYLASKPTSRTASTIYAVLCLLYNLTSERDCVQKVMKNIKKPRFKSKEPQRLTATQAKALLDAIGNDRERGLVFCFLGLGLRLSEALRLNVGDIGEDIIKVTGKERTESMPLIPEIRDALLKLANGHSPEEPLFIGQRGRLSQSTVEYIIKRLFNSAGINGIRQSPHTLRHTRGALTAAAGLDSYSSRRLLRHTTTAMTDQYSQLNMDELRIKEEKYNPLRLLGSHQETFRTISI